MSILVEYHLKPDQDAAQTDALRDLVSNLQAEGVTGCHYSAFSTDDPERFIGLLEFDDDAGRQAFLDSAAFASYRDAAGPRFTGPPSTTPVQKVASTRG